MKGSIDPLSPLSPGWERESCLNFATGQRRAIFLHNFRPRINYTFTLCPELVKNSLPFRDFIEMEFTEIQKIPENNEELERRVSDTKLSLEQEDSDVSDALETSDTFKWLKRISNVDMRIRCDVFLEPPKVHLDLTLSTGRHLCLDNLRQCSDDTIEDSSNKNKTVMVRTYKGTDLLKIKCTHDSKNFSILQPKSDKPISLLNITHSVMEVHNLVQDEWYFVDVSNRRNQQISIRSQSGTELGQILGFGNFEPQSSSNGNVMILRPKLKFIEPSLDPIQKATLLSIFIALGLTFDGDVKKTTDAFNLFSTLVLVIFIICSFVVYRNAESLKAHKNLILLINFGVFLFVVGFLYMVRCCLR